MMYKPNTTNYIKVGVMSLCFLLPTIQLYRRNVTISVTVTLIFINNKPDVRYTELVAAAKNKAKEQENI